MSNFWQTGVDEAGRGPIAGPVAVAAVGIKDATIVEALFPAGIRDSKQMTVKQRTLVLATIRRYVKEGRLVYSCAFASAQSIDELGIVPSCTVAAGGVLEKICVWRGSTILLDGRLHAPAMFTNQASYDKGDSTYPAIALASVVAKCLRDERMMELGCLYPVYGFEVHKGYGTKAHYDALLRHGLSIEHRTTFLTRFLKSRTNPHV